MLLRGEKCRQTPFSTAASVYYHARLQITNSTIEVTEIIQCKLDMVYLNYCIIHKQPQHGMASLYIHCKVT